MQLKCEGKQARFTFTWLHSNRATEFATMCTWKCFGWQPFCSYRRTFCEIYWMKSWKCLELFSHFWPPSPFLSFQIPPHKKSNYIEENIKEAINKTRCKKEEGEKAWLLNRRKASKVLWASLIWGRNLFLTIIVDN